MCHRPGTVHRSVACSMRRSSATPASQMHFMRSNQTLFVRCKALPSDAVSAGIICRFLLVNPLCEHDSLSRIHFERAHGGLSNEDDNQPLAPGRCQNVTWSADWALWWLPASCCLLFSSCSPSEKEKEGKEDSGLTLVVELTSRSRCWMSKDVRVQEKRVPL